jgi:type II secretory pathway pseudopilin PulG
MNANQLLSVMKNPSPYEISYCDPATPQNSKLLKRGTALTKRSIGTVRDEGRRGGFTLVELLIGMVVSFIVIGGAMLVMTSMARSHNTQLRVQALSKNGVSTLDYLASYIRLTGFDPTGLAGAGFGCEIDNDNAAIPYAVEYDWNEKQIAFTIDQGRCSGTDCSNYRTVTKINSNPGGPDGKIDQHWEERIVFAFDNDNSRIIRRNMSHHQKIVVENIDAMHVDYLDSNGAPTTKADEIASVEITLVVVEPATNDTISSHIDTEFYKTRLGTELTLASGRPNPPEETLPDPLPESYKLHRKLLSARVPTENNIL